MCSNPQSAIINPQSKWPAKSQMAEHSIGNREEASSILAAGSGSEGYGKDSSDHHRDKAYPPRGVAVEKPCAQGSGDKAEISSRLDSSDGRAPIS